MEFSSSSVMAYILYKAKKAGHPIGKTQAQKLLYCCYGIVLAAFDERLTDEHPKASPGGHGAGNLVAAQGHAVGQG